MAHHNADPKPFVWNTTVDAILNKIRKCKSIYLLSGDGGAFIEGVREYLSLFDLPLNFVNDSVVIFPANLGDTFDPARHVSIMLNGVLENNLFDDDYFDWIDPAGGAWVL